MLYDVFNGDADGIFALHQLRLSSPVDHAELITGVKRDIALLNRINTARSSIITVLDVSLDKNREALDELLQNDNTILYIDHHFAGDIPFSAALEHHIEPSAETCTSLIVNQMLQGRFSKWAICGAFGDNLHEQANKLAADASLSEEERNILQEIGELFNYNGYGARLKDLLFHPADLYRAVRSYTDPFHFHEATDLVNRLKNGYEEDMAKAMGQKCIDGSEVNRIYRFPAASWSRRIAGVFSNLKAREKVDAAHALIVENDDGTLQISVRAPLVNRKNADLLCRNFPTGGGRSAAAGINNLPAEMLEEFIAAFNTIYRQDSNGSNTKT
ncbi:MAG: DHH family phosphoesterase [Desulfopila sp.]|jgi:hypothetical protein|nr:DHH family phosphoesterase [Desulfopila sp.]